MVSMTDLSTEDDLLGRSIRWARECAQFAALPFAPTQSERLGRLYDIVGTKNLFGEESLFINLGYWKNRPATLDEASADLARLVGREAALAEGDTVLDVGCGYGDQDILWATEFGPTEIIGVNVATEQIAISSARVRERGLDDRIRYVNASAMDLPREDSTCSKVIALESAFHFPSHTKFFAEAHRVLEPGGRLVTADIVPRDSTLAAAARRSFERAGSWRTPTAVFAKDFLDADRYRSALLAAGFENARVYSIRDHVYSPLATFLRKRLRDSDMRQVNPLLRLAFSTTGVRMWSPSVDYIIAIADKGQA